MVTSDTHCHLLATLQWGQGPRRYLGHCGLQHDAFYGQRSRIQHGHHHHQHIGPSWWTFLCEVEEDAEAIFIISCHRKGTACKKVARGYGRSEKIDSPQQNPEVLLQATGESSAPGRSLGGLLSELHQAAQ